MGGKQFGSPGKRGRDSVARARRRPGSLLSGLLLASVALMLVAPAGAGADARGARFVYELCDSAIPGGGPPAAEFHVNPGVAFTPFQNCAAPGGAIGISQTGQVSSSFSYLEIPIVETPGGWVEAETISAVASGFSPGNWPSHVYENAWPANGFAESTRIFHIRNEPAWFFGNGGGFNIAMSCDGNMSPCNPGAVVAAHYIAVTEVDPKPPVLTPPKGSLLAGGVLRGHQELVTEASDVGGGLAKIELLVNGLSAGTPAVGPCAVVKTSNRSYEGIAAVTPSPCPPKLAADFVVDTGAPPFHDGANAVQVCASDFSTLTEANRTCSTMQVVTVDNSCADSSVSGGELLSAQFSKSNRETQTVGFGKEAEVVGTLRTNAGDPVAGATLCVKMQTLEVDAQASPVGTVTTDGNGNYSYKVPAGPNRDIVIGYRHDTSQVARDVRYYAHARPSLHSSSDHLHNGERVKFWGQLQGPHRFGRVVILQANVLGSKRWITFRKATSAGKGIFRAKYHFTSTTRMTTYRFRAVVPDQAGYPWVQGHSKPLSVKVTR